MPRQRGRRTFKRPCTYDSGHVRQDLYSCRKCTKEAGGITSGFCRGCREACHADHPDEVFELYTKRGFRCDCGNKRARNCCVLNPNKDDFNLGNEHIYSHNFSGHYCRCDSEYDYRYAMAQCAMCEDWFHEKCYKCDGVRRSQTSPFAFEYELTCKDCVRNLPVLAEYYELFSVWKRRGTHRKYKGEGCVRPKNVSVSTKAGTLDYMWHPGFRLHLCKCEDCLELYEAGKAPYIADKNDFVSPSAEDEDTEQIGEEDEDEEEYELIEVDIEEPEQPERRKVFDEGARIPRKSASSEKGTQQKTSDTDQYRSNRDSKRPSGVSERSTIRRRITEFLKEAIQTSGGNLSQDVLLQFMTDLKAEMLVGHKGQP